LSAKSSMLLPGPRARFPGDLILRFRGRPLPFLTEVARRYGPFTHFRIGRLHYHLISDPRLIQEVLVTRADCFTKGPALRKAKVTLGEGLLTSEGDLHKRQRRLSQPAFHAQRVAAYVGVMTERALRVSQSWRDGQTLDMHQQMMGLTLGIAAATMFGADVAPERIAQLGHAMSVSVRMFMRALLPFGELLNRLPLPQNVRFWKSWGQLTDTINTFIAERRAKPENGRNDLLSLLLKAQDVEGDGGGMSDQQLRHECVTLFTAGHETTANALTFSWHLLAKHPEVQERMHAELRDVLNGRAPTTDDFPRLVYTRAVFAESMRLYPPAWVVGRQAIRDCRIGDCTIPERGVVLMSQWVVHRDPQWWPEPDRFDPSRWLDESSRTTRPRYAYFPFGSGPRQCIGEPFAWLEGMLVLATIGQMWRVEATNDAPLELEPTITLRPKRGVMLRLFSLSR